MKFKVRYRALRLKLRVIWAIMRGRSVAYRLNVKGRVKFLGDAMIIGGKYGTIDLHRARDVEMGEIVTLTGRRTARGYDSLQRMRLR